MIPLAASVLLLGALIVLVASLDEVSFAPGHPIDRRASTTADSSAREPGVSVVDVRLVRLALFATFTVSLTIFLVGSLLSRFLRRWLVFAVGKFGALIVFDLFASRLSVGPSLTEDGPAPSSVASIVTDPSSGGWTHILAALGVSVGAAAALMLVAHGLIAPWQVHRARQARTQLAWHLETLAAQAATRAQNPDVVLRCYREMVDVLSRQEQVGHVLLTPREFADRLRRLGVQSDAIDRLTALFELVRYGHRDSAPWGTHTVASVAEIRRMGHDNP